MTDELLIVLWGLLAIAMITGIGRWCRAHPGRPPEHGDEGPATR
jgi:hypothetical protein